MFQKLQVCAFAALVLTCLILQMHHEHRYKRRPGKMAQQLRNRLKRD